jgi:hypothetical protein
MTAVTQVLDSLCPLPLGAIAQGGDQFRWGPAEVPTNVPLCRTRSTRSIMASASSPSNKCAKCDATVFPMDPQITLDGTKFHKGCAKCADCSTQITLSNFTKAPDNTLLCKTHYFKRFREEGNYIGGEQFQRKGTADLRKALSPTADAAEASTEPTAEVRGSMIF